MTFPVLDGTPIHNLIASLPHKCDRGLKKPMTCGAETVLHQLRRRGPAYSTKLSVTTLHNETERLQITLDLGNFRKHTTRRDRMRFSRPLMSLGIALMALTGSGCMSNGPTDRSARSHDDAWCSAHPKQCDNQDWCAKHADKCTSSGGN
jgi:hypothetical protein